MKMRSERPIEEVYTQLEEDAALVGLESVPMRRKRQGLLNTLKRLNKQLKPGLAIRLVVPRDLPPSSLRTAWAQIHKPFSHIVIEENNDKTYIAYLWRGK